MTPRTYRCSVVEDNSLQTHRIHAATDPAFAALASIYSNAIAANERKNVDQLSSMLQRPEYIFLVATRENTIVGFAITFCFTGCNACLPEYMAVADGHRGQRIGRYLFTEVTNRTEVAGRFLLVEVDSDKTQTAGPAEAQRKAFYRNLGCKEIEGLRYIMPPVASTQPPEMHLLAYKQNPPPSIQKVHLQTLLQCAYVEVYRLTAGDLRIDQMLKGLPESIRLA
jgi:GNAT superfamily N-acetyltransferase